MQNPATTPVIDFNSRFYQADYGFYLQDMVDIGEPGSSWPAFVTIIRTWSSIDRTRRSPGFGGFPETQTAETFDEGTPRFGLIYEPIPKEVRSTACTARCTIRPMAVRSSLPRPCNPNLGRVGRRSQGEIAARAVGYRCRIPYCQGKCDGVSAESHVGHHGGDSSRQATQPGNPILGGWQADRSLEYREQLYVYRYASNRSGQSDSEWPAHSRRAV